MDTHVDGFDQRDIYVRIDSLVMIPPSVRATGMRLPDLRFFVNFFRNQT